MAHRYFTNKLDEPNARSGKPVRRCGYPTPPGVSDRFWYRLLNCANSQLKRQVKRNEHVGKTPKQLKVMEFRAALRRLAESLREASPHDGATADGLSKHKAEKQAKEQAMYLTRPW